MRQSTLPGRYSTAWLIVWPSSSQALLEAHPELPAVDEPVGDGLALYRLVPTVQCEVVDGEWEFQSAAFDNATPETEEEHPDDMSVLLGDVLALLEREPASLPVELPWTNEHWGVAVLEAGYVRNEEGQELRRTPR